MDNVIFRKNDFPKLRELAYYSGLPGIVCFLKNQGFNTIEGHYITGDLSYKISRKEFLILVLKYGS